MIERLKFVLCLSISVLGTYLILTYVLIIGFVPSASMDPTITEESIIIGNRNMESIQLNDIVVFKKDNILEIKRIVAKENDIIEYQDEKIYINGTYEGECKDKDNEILAVGKNEYYVLGDNRSNSLDSRYWDYPFISKENIEAVLIYHHSF